MFAFLFRNALPGDPASVIPGHDLARQRRRERARNGVALAVPTVFEPESEPTAVAVGASSASRRGGGAAA